ncbi:MAG: hypothetical protein O3B22_16075 [Proteobacteria bacterium]|nr:hypothetical protein [Pseudomonadota bacterium]
MEGFFMIMTRRRFMIGAGGLITAAFVARVIEHIADTGMPLLTQCNADSPTFHVYDSADDGYLLSRGEWSVAPEPPTWRDYLALEGHDLQSDQGVEEVLRIWSFGDEDDLADQLDDRLDPYDWDSLWEHRFSPTARAFEFLRPLDLGVDPKVRGQKVGLLTFHDFGGHPGSDERWVDAPDKLSISLLQARLAELDVGAAFVFEATPTAGT